MNPEFEPPAGFQRHQRSSPMTAPWEPLFARDQDGVISLGLQVREPHCNGRGFAHGGLMASLADNAMGYSAVAQAKRQLDPPPRSALTVGLALDYLDVAHIGDWLEIRPQVLKLGRSLAFCDCRLVALRAEREILVARASASFRLV